MGSTARIALVFLVPTAVLAEAPRDRFSAGGYFRIMTRPDFQGGSTRLGYYNLYGRLLNEGPWAALELKLDVLQARPNTNDVWASIHSKIEGGSVSNADSDAGRLDRFALKHLYIKAGNVLLDRVVWQLGTLEFYQGDLGLYDVRGAQLFEDTIGLSGTWQSERLMVLFGIGDSGFALGGREYSTVFTAGAFVRLRLFEGFELGGGGQYAYEPAVPGNRFAPYYTPGIGDGGFATYEDYVRGEVARRYVEAYPGREDLFPRPEATSARSWRAVGYWGFGRLGPLRWNNFFVEYRRLHPLGSTVEHFQGRDYPIYLASLTDERYQLSMGNEMQLSIVPDRLEAAWAVLHRRNVDLDNAVKPGEDNFLAYSTVLRLQLSLTRTVHLLAESSLAQEKSLNGNLYRQHADSIFTSEDGMADSRGLEFGDSDTRNTWQLKTGVVLNPTGFGIYVRPSLRLLYGLQYSSQQAAFGHGFVEKLDDYNHFPSPERHWHSVVAIEAEAWF